MSRKPFPPVRGTVASWRALPALLLVVLLTVTACGAGGSGDDEGEGGATAPSTAPATPGDGSPSPPPAPAPPATGEDPAPADPATVTLSPADGEDAIDPRSPVTVEVEDGRLGDVRVTDADGDAVDGTLQDDGRTWRPDGAFALGGRYTVTATALNAADAPTTATATFSTLSGERKAVARISPADGRTVGVGFPLSLEFDHPVTRKAAVEKALKVETSPAVEGAWHWFGDTRVDYRPKDYWKPGTVVKVHVNLRGVDIGGGVVADQYESRSFTIAGTARVAKVDVRDKRMKVYEDGELVRTIPVTAGEPKYATWNGSMVVTEKFTRTRMDSRTVGLGEEYDIPDVPYAIRITDSGTFVHGNYWADPSVFGEENTSHGCVSMTEENAKWFFDRVNIGDVVEVTGSSEDTVAPDNGYGDWNLTWDEWRRGDS